MKGKEFYQAVLEVAKLIPRWRVTTYGAIAAYLGNKSSSRLVGWALNKNPHPDVPAQRVVNRIGLLTGKHFFQSPTAMQAMLEAEGVKVENDQVVDFEKLFWDPAHELL